jgi:hypothetical protein
MEVDKDKIKNATTSELIDQLNMIKEACADRMFPMSYAAAQRSIAWKVEIEKELYIRTNRRW